MEIQEKEQFGGILRPMWDMEGVWEVSPGGQKPMQESARICASMGLRDQNLLCP